MSEKSEEKVHLLTPGKFYGCDALDDRRPGEPGSPKAVEANKAEEVNCPNCRNEDVHSRDPRTGRQI